METLCLGCACFAITSAFVLGGINASAHSVAQSNPHPTAAAQVSDR